MPDVLLATGADMPGLCDDDQILLERLNAAGLATLPAVWSDPTVDWADAKLAVVRSTWDYVDRHGEFVAWSERTASATKLLNSPELIRWNIDKRYLRELDEQGVAIVPSEWLVRGATPNVRDYFARWEKIAIKPVVGANASDLAVGTESNAPRLQDHLDRLLEAGDVIVQKYLHSVETLGELSLVYVDGHFTHAVRKYAKRGDHRVQEEHGGRTEVVTPTDAEREIGDRLVAGVEGLYARVDLLDDGGVPLLGEFEVIEPELYFRYDLRTADKMVDAIRKRLAL